MRRGLAALLVAAALAGCRTAPGPPDLVRVEGEDERARGLLAEVARRGDDHHALRLVGKLRVDGPEGSGSVRQVVLVERPSSLRFETLSVLNQTLSLLVTDGTDFAFYDGEQLSSGDVHEAVLLERLGLDLAPAEAVSALLAAPSVDSAPNAVFARDSERIVQLADRRVHFDAAGQLLGVEVLDARGATRWRVHYGAWQDVPGGRFPFELELFFPATQLRAQLRASRVELDPQLDPALFAPPGVARE